MLKVVGIELIKHKKTDFSFQAQIQVSILKSMGISRVSLIEISYTHIQHIQSKSKH